MEPIGEREIRASFVNCSTCVRSVSPTTRRQPKMRLVRREETLTLDERIDRAMTKLAAFTGRILAG
jgi:hypothetical protein